MYLLKPLQSFKGVLTRPCLAGAAVKTLLVVTLFALGYLQFERYFKNILIRNAQAEVSQQLHAMVNGRAQSRQTLIDQNILSLPCKMLPHDRRRKGSGRGETALRVPSLRAR